MLIVRIVHALPVLLIRTGIIQGYIFHISQKKPISCDSSNEGLQYMFSLRNKENYKTRQDKFYLKSDSKQYNITLAMNSYLLTYK